MIGPPRRIKVDPTIRAPLQWTVKECLDQRAVEYGLTIEFADFKLAMTKCSETDAIQESTRQSAARCKEDYRLFRKWLFSGLGRPLGARRKYQHVLGRSWGRRYAQGGLSCQSARRIFRGLVNREAYDDIDVVNSAPTFYDQLCDDNQIRHPYLKEYVADRTKILAEVMAFYNCDKDAAKNMFTVAMYSDKLQKYTHPFLNKYDQEMKDLQKAFVALDQYKFIRPFVEKETNQLGTFFSYVYHFHEGQMIDAVMQFLEVSEAYDYVEVGVLAFDGLQIKKDDRNDTALLQALSMEVQRKLGFRLRFIYKPMDDSIVIPDDFEYKGLMTFEQKCEDFNEMHCKTGTMYIMKRNNENVILSRNQIKERYEHISVYKDSVEVNFIDHWLRNNSNIDAYADMNVYPVASMCPDDEYNLWTPFAYDRFEEDYERDNQGLEKILRHIAILCNHDKESTEFVLMWLAHMVQHPEQKSVVVIFVSKEGAGKGTLMELLRRLFGKKKVFESSNPRRDVWGDFNGPMKEAFLVNLNEISAKDFYEAHGKYKALVTDPTIMINKKGQDQVEIESFHRFLGTTNNENNAPTQAGDRRNFIIRCSDEVIGRDQYHEEMHRVICDLRATRTFWDFLKQYKCPLKINHSHIPTIAYHTDLKMQNQSPLHHWIEHLTRTALENDAISHALMKGREAELKKPNTSGAQWEEYRNYVKWAELTCYLRFPQFQRQMKALANEGYFKWDAVFRDGSKAVRGMVLEVGHLASRFGIEVLAGVDAHAPDKKSAPLGRGQRRIDECIDQLQAPPAYGEAMDMFCTRRERVEAPASSVTHSPKNKRCSSCNVSEETVGFDLSDHGAFFNKSSPSQPLQHEQRYREAMQRQREAKAAEGGRPAPKKPHIDWRELQKLRR